MQAEEDSSGSRTRCFKTTVDIITVKNNLLLKVLLSGYRFYIERDCAEYPNKEIIDVKDYCNCCDQGSA